MSQCWVKWFKLSSLSYTGSQQRDIGSAFHDKTNSDKKIMSSLSESAFCISLYLLYAFQVALILNGAQMGGKRRSAYHYDLWNLKYLPKFKWDHLTEEISMPKAPFHRLFLKDVWKDLMVPCLNSSKCLICLWWSVIKEKWLESCYIFELSICSSFFGVYCKMVSSRRLEGLLRWRDELGVSPSSFIGVQ